jgi:NAD(P)-dependent dehydrogenase (short-subunit alcohol dehydrogenase family)
VDFAGKVVLVAGAGSGIGRAAALGFAELGASVIVADLDSEGAATTCEMGQHYPGRLQAAHVDVTDRAACQGVVDDAVAAHGRLDALVNGVGWTAITPFLDEDEEYWRKVVDVNLMSCVFLAHAAASAMSRQGGGAIVLTSSDAGRVGTSGETVYAATKAGVIGFTKSLAREVARHGIRVNAVSPGPTDTPLLEWQGGEDLVAKIRASIPMKRLAAPHEPADAMLFLASDRAAYITGQTLSVSGGLTMGS